MGKNIINETCYMCRSQATSMEHVPPRCLFPEEKDFKGVNLRKNLLTVPSCDVHNIEKSQDDQFLMAALAGVVGNNIVGYVHTNTKVKRALDRKKDLLNSIMFDAKKIIGETIEGLKFPLLKGSPDINRLTKCFEHIAYGLFFIEYKTRFEGECNVFISFVRYKDLNLEKTKILVKRELSKDDIVKMKGENPSVFKYHFYPPDQSGIILLRLFFYEGSEVFAAFKPKDLRFNLFLELSKISDKTIFKFDNGETIEFSNNVRRFQP